MKFSGGRFRDSPSQKFTSMRPPRRAEPASMACDSLGMPFRSIPRACDSCRSPVKPAMPRTNPGNSHWSGDMERGFLAIYTVDARRDMPGLLELEMGRSQSKPEHSLYLKGTPLFTLCFGRYPFFGETLVVLQGRPQGAPQNCRVPLSSL